MVTFISLICGLALAGASWYFISKGKSSSEKDVATYNAAIAAREEATVKAKELLTELVPKEEIIQKGQLYTSTRITAEAEQARFAILQAEIETVELRLRELEEIERELQAGTHDATAELKRIQEKLVEGTAKTEGVRTALGELEAYMQSVATELADKGDQKMDLEARMVTVTNSCLVADHLVKFLEQSSNAYHKLKLRYDALDIEYAQLFERLNAADDTVAK